VLGWWAWVPGAPGDARELFLWKADCALAQAEGRDGWPLGHANTTYWIPADAVDAAVDWGDLAQRFGIGGGPPLGGDMWYANYGLGVLEWLVIHGVDGAQGPRDYMLSQVYPRYAKYAWSEEGLGI
jgi:hypothetical protein